MQQRTLLTQAEATKYSELGSTFPTCNLSDILQSEESEFLQCLGWDLYELMFAQLADYSAVVPWVAGSYLEGNLVSHRGTIWKAKQTTATEPLAENAFWGVAPKFNDDTECGTLYNVLWCNYMARYLSLKVAIMTIGRVAVKATGNGVVRFSDNSAIPADSKEIAFLLNSVTAQAAQTFANMASWIERQNNTTCFPVQVCDPCGGKNAMACTANRTTSYYSAS